MLINASYAKTAKKRREKPVAFWLYNRIFLISLYFVASGPMARGHFPQLRLLLAAPLFRIGAAGVEPASGGHIGRRRHLALEDDPLSFLPAGQNGNGRKQSLGIGMLGMIKQLFCGGRLHDLAQVHHHHPIGNVFHHIEGVGNEEIGHVAVVFLQLSLIHI